MLSAFDMNKYYLSQKVLCEIYVWKFQTKFVLGEINVNFSRETHVNALLREFHEAQLVIILILYLKLLDLT